MKHTVITLVAALLIIIALSCSGGQPNPETSSSNESRLSDVDTSSVKESREDPDLPMNTPLRDLYFRSLPKDEQEILLSLSETGRFVLSELNGMERCRELASRVPASPEEEAYIQQCREEGVYASDVPISLPELPPPMVLDSLTFKKSDEEVVKLLETLPVKIAGEERTPQYDKNRKGYHTISYGMTDSGPELQLGLERYNTGTNAAEALQAIISIAMTPHGGANVEAAGRDGNIVWVRSTPFSDGLIVFQWTNSESEWVFGASAFTPDELEELIAAFQVVSKDAVQ